MSGSPSRTVELVIAGFGHVGRAFVRLVAEKTAACRERYGLDLRVRAILKSDGGFFTGGPLGLPDVFAGDELFQDGNAAWRPGLALDQVLAAAGPGGCLVECTPSDLRTGEPGLRHFNQAFGNGWHVAAASKGALVKSFASLRRDSESRGLALKFSGATAAALPTLDVGLYALAGAEVRAIEGSLNGVCNLILTRMAEGGTYADALRETQARGIAEADPIMDVGGFDTAAKILLIANAVLGLGASLEDVAIEGITGVTPKDIAEARSTGRAIKLLGRCFKPAPGGPWTLRVGPEAIPLDHPLAGLSGANKGITFRTDTMGDVTVTGGASSPRATGAALLKDILNIFPPR